MATRFVGRHEHSLDVKGRIILPARYRSSFDTVAYLSKNTERCLALWTPDAFERKLDEMEARFDRTPQDRAMVRAWASGSTDVELDRQGRVAIPGYLREYARLEDAVLIHGAISHIELWDPEEWAIRGVPGDDELADPTSTAFMPATSGGPFSQVAPPAEPSAFRSLRPISTTGSVITESATFLSPIEAHRPMRSLSTGRVEVPFSARFHSVRSGRNPDGTLVEGLRIGRLGPRGGASVTELPGAYRHRPVMVDEVVSLLAHSPPGVLLDATLGGAGHARALLDAAPQLTLIGLDQDPDAVGAATAVLEPYGPRAAVESIRFDRIPAVLAERGLSGISAALFDLGVSSPQLDRPERGFSYRQSGPLDMRMDPSRPVSAYDVVNDWPESALVNLFRAHGEPRFARRLARAIVAARPIESTARFVEVVRDAIPAAARRTGGHPARRVFQAVRVAVNEELDILPDALDAALTALIPGGRCVVISYHSGEDRITKERFREGVTGGCHCPPGLPCVCGAVPTLRLLTRGALRPSPGEVLSNPRAESARLRAAERLGVPPESSGSAR